MADDTTPADATREQYLVDSLVQLEGMAKREKGVARVQAKKAAIAVRNSLDELRETQRAARAAPATPEEHRSEVLAVVRRLRIGAAAAGSYTAAQKLLDLEHTLLERRYAAADAVESEELERRELAELEAEIEALRAERLPH